MERFKKGQVWERNDDFFTVIGIHPDHPNEARIEAKDGRKLFINIHIVEALGYKLREDRYSGESMKDEKDKICKCIPFVSAFPESFWEPKGKPVRRTKADKLADQIANLEERIAASENEAAIDRMEKQKEELEAELEAIESTDLEGIVISEEVAKLAPCIRVKGTNLVFTKGIVGALNEKQRAEFCPTIVEVERPKFEARIERWKDAINTCKERTKHLIGGEKLKQYVDCMSIEARKD